MFLQTLAVVLSIVVSGVSEKVGKAVVVVVTAMVVAATAVKTPFLNSMTEVEAVAVMAGANK